MAKITLKDSVNEDEIIDLGEVDVPNIVLEEKSDSGYGIKGNYGDYSLVEKKISYRSVKEDDNVDKKYKVAKYITWLDVPSFHSTLIGCIDAWIDKRNLTRIKALKKANFGEVEKICNETKKLVSDAMSKLTVDDSLKQNAIQMDNYNKLLEATERSKSLIRECEKFEELLKEKRRIVIKDTEPKKHRTPKEND